MNKRMPNTTANTALTLKPPKDEIKAFYIYQVELASLLAMQFSTM